MMEFLAIIWMLGALLLSMSDLDLLPVGTARHESRTKL